MTITGQIQRVRHTPGSGLVTIDVLDESGDYLVIHADAGPFYRAASQLPIELGQTYSFDVDELNVCRAIAA